jgi:hypothetical protein
MMLSTAQLDDLSTASFHEGATDKAPVLTCAFRKLLQTLDRLEPIEVDPDVAWQCPWIRTKGRRAGWHECKIRIYKKTAHVSFRQQHAFAVNLQTGEWIGLRLYDHQGRKDAGYEFADWLLTALAKELGTFFSNPYQYNRRISQKLPYRCRSGKIRRKDLWTHQERKVPVRDELTREEIGEFLSYAGKCDGRFPAGEMTRHQFLKFCSIAYDAVFPGDETRSFIERYRLHADGRDDGLRRLPAHNAAAFERWIKKGSQGGHPWEIVRGGNSTHISFQCHYGEGAWNLYLDGHSTVCIARTVKIGNAFHRAKVRFNLAEEDYLTQVVQGHDWIGIVPENVYPAYCDDIFSPYGERILAFMQLGEFEGNRAFLSKVIWHPIRPFAVRDRGDLPGLGRRDGAARRPFLFLERRPV